MVVRCDETMDVNRPIFCLPRHVPPSEPASPAFTDPSAPATKWPTLWANVVSVSVNADSAGHTRNALFLVEVKAVRVTGAAAGRPVTTTATTSSITASSGEMEMATPLMALR